MPLMYLEIHAMSELLHWSLSTLGDHLGEIVASTLIVFVGGWCLLWIYLGFVGRGGWRNRSWEDWEDEDNHHADDGGD